MALKAPDMSKCSPKKKCCGGPNQGTVYDPFDPCDSGFAFDPDTCDCNPLYPGPSRYMTVTGTVQRHDTQPCGGIPSDPILRCTSFACPTSTLGFSSLLSTSNWNRDFQITGFVELSAYSPTNGWCPTNITPAGTTYADIWPDVELIRQGTGWYYASQRNVNPVSASLWAMAVDSAGKKWAMEVMTGWSGQINFIFNGQYASNINVVAS